MEKNNTVTITKQKLEYYLKTAYFYEKNKARSKKHSATHDRKEYMKKYYEENKLRIKMKRCGIDDKQR